MKRRPIMIPDRFRAMAEASVPLESAVSRWAAFTDAELARITAAIEYFTDRESDDTVTTALHDELWAELERRQS